MTTEPTPAITDTPAALPTPATEMPAPTPPATPSAWPLRFDVTILALLLVLSFLVASFTAANSDLWMHFAVGKRLTEGMFTFGVDPFSWATEAFGDQPAVYWTHHSWLYSWLVYHLYYLIGGPGLVIGKAILFTATIAILCRVGWNAANRWFLLFCLVMAALATAHRLLLQPVVVSYLFLAITLFILYRVGIFAQKHQPGAEATGLRSLWALPPLFALWANLDSWFILGPIVLALCWAGTGLAKWYPNGNPVPGKTLGMVLGVGLLACLLNPHHIHVFELPPELAFVVLSLTDRLGIPMPEGLVAGGRTLVELHKVDFTWTYSTMSPKYWQEPRIGLNIAGCAVFFLLILGLVSFTLMAFVKAQPNAPTLQVNRFLIWLVFGVLALALSRLIPFFALLAAPLTAMTLGEFLLWQQDRNAVTVEKRERGLAMARFTSVPFMLLLLFFAWPGWLTGSFDNYSPHRVEWNMEPDASMRQAAQTLQELKQRGKCQNAFNASFELAQLFPWYAPDVKYFMDTRFSLYPRHVAEFVKARAGLTDLNKPADEWRPLFVERNIDQAIIGNPLAGNLQAGTPLRVYKWWLNPEQWRQRYGDSQVMVFSWARANKSWSADTARQDGNRQAFGKVNADKRPPEKGFHSPQPTSHLTLYLDGVGPTPIGLAQYKAHLEYFNLESRLQPTRAVTLMCLSLVNLQATPFGGAGMIPLVVVAPNEQMMLRTLDFGPPAQPILMVRAARRAIQQNPLDVEGYRALFFANHLLRNNQEDHWIGYQRGSGFAHPSGLRDRLRQVQLMAGAFDIVQLAPDNYDQQLLLAQLYGQANLLDSALEQLLLAEKALELRLTAGGKDVPKDVKERDLILKTFRDKRITPLDQVVRARLAKLKEKSDAKPLEQAAFAYRGTIEEMNGNQVVEARMGLSKKALEILLTIKPESLNGDEQSAFLNMQFELLCDLGRIDIVSEHLKKPNIRAALHELSLARYQLISAGMLGDYPATEEALAVIEKAIRADVKPMADILTKKRLEAVPAQFVTPTLGWPSPLATLAVTGLHYRSIDNLYRALQASYEQHNHLYNAMTLQGIVALESGNTQRAREIFAATLDEAGNEYFFSDRKIARRYLDLLNEQK